MKICKPWAMSHISFNWQKNRPVSLQARPPHRRAILREMGEGLVNSSVDPCFGHIHDKDLDLIYSSNYLFLKK